MGLSLGLGEIGGVFHVNIRATCSYTYFVAAVAVAAGSTAALPEPSTYPGSYSLRKPGSAAIAAEPVAAASAVIVGPGAAVVGAVVVEAAVVAELEQLLMPAKLVRRLWVVAPKTMWMMRRCWGWWGVRWVQR